MSNRFRFNAVIIRVVKPRSTPREMKIELVYPSRKRPGEFNLLPPLAFAADGRIIQVPDDADVKSIKELDLAGFACTETWLPPPDIH